MMAASKKEDQFGDVGAVKKDEIATDLLQTDSIVKDIKTVYSEGMMKSMNGDNGLAEFDRNQLSFPTNLCSVAPNNDPINRLQVVDNMYYPNYHRDNTGMTNYHRDNSNMGMTNSHWDSSNIGMANYMENSTLGMVNSHMESRNFGMVNSHRENSNFGLANSHRENSNFGMVGSHMENNNYGMVNSHMENRNFGMVSSHMENRNYGMVNSHMENNFGMVNSHMENRNYGMVSPHMENSAYRMTNPHMESSNFGMVNPHMERSTIGMANTHMERNDIGMANTHMERNDIGMANTHMERNDIGMANTHIDRNDIGMTSSHMDGSNIGMASSETESSSIIGLANSHLESGIGMVNSNVESSNLGMANCDSERGTIEEASSDMERNDIGMVNAGVEDSTVGMTGSLVERSDSEMTDSEKQSNIDIGMVVTESFSSLSAVILTTTTTTTTATTTLTTTATTTPIITSTTAITSTPITTIPVVTFSNAVSTEPVFNSSSSSSSSSSNEAPTYINISFNCTTTTTAATTTTIDSSSGYTTATTTITTASCPTAAATTTTTSSPIDEDTSNIININNNTCNDNTNNNTDSDCINQGVVEPAIATIAAVYSGDVVAEVVRDAIFSPMTFTEDGCNNNSGDATSCSNNASSSSSSSSSSDSSGNSCPQISDVGLYDNNSDAEKKAVEGVDEDGDRPHLVSCTPPPILTSVENIKMPAATASPPPSSPPEPLFTVLKSSQESMKPSSPKPASPRPAPVALPSQTFITSFLTKVTDSKTQGPNSGSGGGGGGGDKKDDADGGGGGGGGGGDDDDDDDDDSSQVGDPECPDAVSNSLTQPEKDIGDNSTTLVCVSDSGVEGSTSSSTTTATTISSSSSSNNNNNNNNNSLHIVTKAMDEKTLQQPSDTTTNNNNNNNQNKSSSSKYKTKIKTNNNNDNNSNNNNNNNVNRKSIMTCLKDGASNDKEIARKNELESLFVSSPLLASSLSSKPLSLQHQPTPPPALPLLLIPQPTQTLDPIASEGKREETLVTETEANQQTSRTSPVFSTVANCPTNLQTHDASLPEKRALSTPPPPVVSVAVSSSIIPDASTSDTRSSPPATPPSLTPAFQLPSSGLLSTPVDQVSKPTPKARKSGTPANQSNHYVKTVNLAPIANIRIKLPVIENSYNSSPKSPPASPLKINKVNSSKFDFPDKDEPLSLSDSENSRSKSIRPRKRRWGTYDLPNKKRKKIFKRNNENSGQDDMDDDDDDEDDDDDVSRDGEDLPEKTPSLEPVECDTKKTINSASPVIKNSSTILELLTKKSHTVATTKEENSGPIMPHLRRSRVPSQHRRSSTKSGHTGKTVAELLRESQAKQLAAKEFHNTTAAHQSAPYLLKEADRVIDITHKMDDCGKENSGSKLPELKKGLQNISPKTVVLGSKSNTVKNSTKKPAAITTTTTAPALPSSPLMTSTTTTTTTTNTTTSSITSTSSYRTLSNPPTTPINVVMTSEGAKVSILGQMVAAAPLYSTPSTSLTSPGLRSLLGPNSIALTPTPTPKPLENNHLVLNEVSTKGNRHTPHWTHPYRGGKTHTHITRGRLIHTKGHPVTSPHVVLPLCCCKINGITFKKLRAVTYCQALDSIDGKVMGCCNKVTNSLLVRPAIKIPFMAVCEFHRQSLKQHQCCPGCGHFCMQGRFCQCRKQGGSTIHNFHKQCQLFLDNKSYCPHCGEESSQYEVMLTLNEPRIISTIEEKTVTQLEPSLPKSRAKLSIHLKTYKAQEKKSCKSSSLEEGAKKVTFEPSASSSPTVFTSAGIPKGKDREILEKCFSILEQERPKKYRTLPKSLYNPCKEGDLAKVIYMLVDGADPNKRDADNDDQTAVHAAAINGHLAILHVLIQAGGNIHIVDGRLNNAIIYACENNHLPIVKFLVQAGAQIDVKGEDGMTCLHMAAKGGYIDLMEFLLSTRKADVNVQDDGGWTPVIWAAEHRNVESAKFLIQRGADPTLKDNEENTGLHWAAFSGSVEIAELFLDYGCELESPNEHGDRPLHISVRQDNYECVVLCLLRGADITARNNINQLPSDCCLDQKSNVWMALNVNKELRDLASKRLERSEKLVHRDISFGRENFPINSINAIDDEGPPLDFQYVTQSVETTPLNLNRVISSLQSCNCQDSCASMLCVCSRNSVQCWYDQMGRLAQEFNQLEPPYIFECNRNCRCWTTCNNRVVQNGIVCRLQLFKTKGRGWGVKTLRDIPQGVFICEYIGELISDSEADRREDDSYLFDLDNKDGETYCIDARRYGNISRFINHLCEPNVIPVKVFVDHQDMRFPRICFFASRDIKAGEEMGFDYGEKFWVIKWKQFTCACGSPRCKYSADTIRRTLEEYRLRHGEDDTPQES